MAGKKVTRAGADILDRAGEDAVLEARANGESVAQIRARFGVSVRQLYGWLGGLHEPKRKAEAADGTCRRERWNAATAQAAEAIADRAVRRLELLTRADGRMLDDVSREEVALAKALSDADRWRAETLDPATFRPAGAGAAGGQVVNIGTLHLTAVAAVGGGSRRALRAATAPTPAEDVEDAEVVPEEG